MREMWGKFCKEMFERAKENLAFNEKKLAKAHEEFDKGEIAEAVHYIWVVFENCVNIIKDAKNNKPLYEHKSKTDVLALYHALGYLTVDYSSTFAVLEKLRIRADFGEYSNAPALPEKSEIQKFLEAADELFGETRRLISHLEEKRKVENTDYSQRH